MDKKMKYRVRPIGLVVWNMVFIIIIISIFTRYTQTYSQKLYDQNVNDISNVNQASAQIAYELSTSQERKLTDIKQYLLRNDMTKTEFMRFVSDHNSDDNVTLQLIGADYTGNVLLRDADVNYPEVSYASSDYNKIRQIVDGSQSKEDDISFSVEFTDNYTAARSFARYVYVNLLDEDGTLQSYTLMMVYRSEDFVSHINLKGGFEESSTVLINEDGSYVIRNSDFKSDSLYQYFYTYNNLPLDDLKYIKELILSDDGGQLRYNNSEGQDCVFVYTAVDNTDWFCITAVPVASFHNEDTQFYFTLVLFLLLLVLMVSDLLYFADLNKHLKERTIAANAANEAKTDFLSRMSHDIRTPINVISGMTELALLEENSQGTREYLTNIQSSNRFLLGLVNDILDMNKVESGMMELHMKPYRHSEFVTYLKAVIAPLCAEKEIHFTIEDDITTEDLAIQADSLRLNQVFFNLLSNACKFTDVGGNIHVRGKFEYVSEKRIRMNSEIQDDGAGMSKEFQKNMFNKFAQESRTEAQNKNGTGLGLAIVKNLVDLMGGSIRVESEIGEGTCFYLEFEFETVDVATLPSKEDTQVVELTGRHILLCEDHPLNIKIMEQLLNRKEMTVDVAENGQIGYEKFQSSKLHQYDAILMDIRMPVMNGLETTKAIRALDRPDAMQIPIIALTANAYDSDVEECLKAGMNTHLAKPIEPEILYTVIAQQIQPTVKRITK